METTTARVVADNVRALIARHDMSQNGFADLIGWDRNRLSKRMTGRIQFRIDELGQIARALDTTPALLLTPGAGR